MILKASVGANLRERRRYLLYLGLLAAALVHVAAQFALWLPLHMAPADFQCDYQVYFEALRQLHAGQALYAPWPGYGPHLKPMPYNYPPPFIAFLYPLGNLSETDFSRLWHILMVVAFWLYAWCLARLACRKVGWDAVLISGLLLALCPGMVHAMSLGNVQPVLTALWGVAFAFNARAVALAITAVVKIHPILPLGVVFLDRARHDGWRAALRKIAAPSAAIFIGALILGLIVCGPEAYLRWARNVPPVLSQGTFEGANASLSIGVLRLLRACGIWHYETGPLPTGPRLFLTASTLIGPLTTWWLARRWPDDLRQSCVGAATVLFAPLCWIDYLPIFLVPLCIWRREIRLGHCREWVLLRPRPTSAPETLGH